MLILASSSSRRRDLLRSAGIPFEVRFVDVPEVHMPGELPLDFARRLAQAKARAVPDLNAGEYILAADTIVVCDNEILGKPRDPSDARRMLRLLSGKWHQVITAVCLLCPTNLKSDSSSRELLHAETTRVCMTALSDEQISFYVSTGEPMDKAGAYAIQGMASRWVLKIEGDYSNVVGLPVAQVYHMLRQEGALE